MDQCTEASEQIGAMTARLETLLSRSTTLGTEHRAVLEEAEELIAAINGVALALNLSARRDS